MSRYADPFAEPKIQLAYARRIMFLHKYLDFVVHTLQKMEAKGKSKLTEEEIRGQNARKQYLLKMLDYSKYSFEQQYY